MYYDCQIKAGLFKSKVFGVILGDAPMTGKTGCSLSEINHTVLFQVITPTLPSPFPGLRAAGSSTRGRVWEGVKKGNFYTIKITSLAKIA